MQILSALDAVSPAIARTKLVLFTPFRKGRTWKLCATSYLAFSGTVFFPFTFIYLIFLPQLRGENKSGLAILLIAAVVFGTALYAFLFYLCSRIQFAFFDLVLNRGEFVAPAWRKYGPQAWRWTGVKILLGTLALAAIAAPAAAYVRNMTALMERMSQLRPGQPPPPEFMAGFFAAYGFVLLFFGSWFLIVATLDAFIVPSLALENVTLGEAFRRLGVFIRREPGQFLGYVAIKTGLGVVGYVCVTIAFEIAIFIVALIVGLGAFVIGWLLHAIGVPLPLLYGLGIFLAVVFYLFIIGYGLMLAIGPIFTFMQAYTLYFLGGRYPLLGDLLERSTPPPMPPPGYAYPAPPPIYSPAAYVTSEPLAPTLPPADPDSHS